MRLKSPLFFEWFCTSAILLLMASFVIIAKVNANRAASTIEASDLRRSEVLVTIEGAVSKPGEFAVAHGTTVGEALRKARLKPFADLQKIDLKEEILEPKKFVIEELKEIVVSISGCGAQEEKLTLPIRTRVCDLKSKLTLNEGADRSFLRSRRMLKNGEIIEVKKKTVD